MSSIHQTYKFKRKNKSSLHFNYWDILNEFTIFQI